MMSVLGCGLNTSGQIVKDGPAILCCPSQVFFPPNITAASVAFSHILWRTASGWQLTGHDVQDPKRRLSLKSSWKVCACENRIAAINDDGSVLVWDKYWKALHFQKKDETVGVETITEDNCCRNDKVKESSNVDVNTNCQVKQVEHETSRTRDVENCIGNKVNSNQNFDWRENMNKRRKLETFTEDKRPVTVNKCVGKEKVTFIKVAVEDNALLALDSDGVMYRGSIPVPLRMKVKDVAVGKEHSMALTNLGDIITWGSGMRGQLGIGELCRSEKPVPVESLQGVPITTIDCGAWHCTALSLSGDLYVWGWNESGQLGFPYRCEGSQSLFTFFEHSCRCPKGSPSKDECHSEGEPQESYDSCAGSKDSGCSCVERGEGEVEGHRCDEKIKRERISKEGKESNEDIRGWNEGKSKEVERREGTIKDECEERIERSKEHDERHEYQQDRRLDNEIRETHGDVREGMTEEDNTEHCRERIKSKEMIENRVNPERRQELINVMASPVLMDFWTEDVNITNVQCGDRHTLYMLDDGSVWSAGMNRYGQLGLGHVKAVKEPCRVFRRGISDMCAGGWNSVFLTNARDSTS